MNQPPLPIQQTHARRALARELETLLNTRRISQRRMAGLMDTSQSRISRIVNGTASISHDELAQWVNLTRGGQAKLEDLLLLNEAAARAGSQPIPDGSTVWSFSFTYVEPPDDQPFVAVSMNQAELLVTGPDRDLVDEHRLQMERIAGQILNQPELANRNTMA